MNPMVPGLQVRVLGRHVWQIVCVPVASCCTVSCCTVSNGIMLSESRIILLMHSAARCCTFVECGKVS